MKEESEEGLWYGSKDEGDRERRSPATL